ncbi:tensin-2-like [Arapaima gigas]
MERRYDFDLTYITEKIISVFFPIPLEEERYRTSLKNVSAMLKSKHQDKFLLFNLSEKRHDITHLNPKVIDFGWPDFHAPHLDKISAICRAMENWLASDPQHVVVLSCKGHRGKTEIIVSAYRHYSEICAGDYQVLSTLAMKRFCENKVLSFLQPSQKRYIYYFKGLLSGAIKMNNSPLFLQQVLIPNLPNFQPDKGFFPFLKIYQSMQLLYTSGVYNPQGSRTRRLCVSIEPALLLKGDIMVKCYHWRAHGAERDTVFRLQFHTGTIQGAQLWFSKEELDEAITDNFPSDAKVEFIFSSGPHKMKGSQLDRKNSEVMVEYAPLDPLLRWDSYENFNVRHQDSTEDISHKPGPLDGSLYAQVKKRHGPGPNTLISINDGLVGKVKERPSPLIHINSTLRYPSATTEHCGYNPQFFSSKESEPIGVDDHLGEIGGKNVKETTMKEDKTLMDSRCPPPMKQSGTDRAGPWSGCCEDFTHVASISQPNEYFPDRSYNCKSCPTRPTSPYPCPVTSPEPTVMCEHRKAPAHRSLPWNLQCYSSESSKKYFCPCRTQDAALPSHAYTLPPSGRLPCRNEEFTPFHQSSSQHQLYFHRSQTANLSHEMSHNGQVFPRCNCQRQESPMPIGTFCALRLGGEMPQKKEVKTGLRTDLDTREADMYRNRERQQRQEQELMWCNEIEAHRENEERGSQQEKDSKFWHQKHRCSPYLPQLPQFDSQPCGPLVCPEPSLTQFPNSSNSNLDLKNSCDSSGYQTPRRPCSCSTDQPSLSESRGYASGYQSGSISPLPTYVEDSIASLSSTGTHDSLDLTAKSTTPYSHSKFGHLFESVMEGHHQVLQSAVKEESPDAVCTTHLEVSRPPSPAHIQRLCPEEAEFFETKLKAIPASEVCSQLQESPPPTEKHHNLSLSHHDPQCVTITNITSPSTTELLESTVIAEESTNLQTTPFYSAPSLEPTCPGLGSAKLQLTNNLPEDRGLETDSSLRGSPYCNSIQQPPCSFSQLSSFSPRCLTSPKHPPPGSPSMAQNLEAESSEHQPPHSDLNGHNSHHIPHSPDGFSTPSFPMSTKYYPLSIPLVPYTGYTAVTIPSPQPELPEKRRVYSTDSTQRPSSGPHSSKHLLRPNPPHAPPPSLGELPSLTKSNEGSLHLGEEIQNRVKFVQDRSQFWYKPDISRDQAVAVLKGMEPGAFLMRDSSSFQGAYGLALKVAVLPPNATSHSSKGDPQEQLVRHFLIEKGPRGVKIRGCPNEPYFGSLSALVHHHSITPISLPCTLRLPESDPVKELPAASSTSTAADLLKQGAACNVLYLNSVETESLTGPQAIAKATSVTLSREPHPDATVVHFKVSAQGITLSDNQRRLFFRRHYPVNSVTFSSVDPQERRWTNSNSTATKIFGFVAKKAGSASENICHLFAELDPEQPATAIVNFINKVLLRL